MLKSSGYVLIAKLLIAGLNFTSIIIISRWLGPVERGVCSWYLVVIAVSLVFSEMIAGPAAGFLLRDYGEKQVRFISYVWAIITSIITTGFFFFLHKIESFEWLILFVLCWLNAANSLHLHLLLARQQIKRFNGLAVFIPAAVIICLVIFFIAGFTSRISYLYSLLIAWSVAFFMGKRLLKKFLNVQPPGNSIRQLIRDGFKNGIANQASHLAGLLNSRMIFFILPATILGVYSNALSLAEASLMIPGSFGQVMYASILNEKNKQGSARKARQTWWLSIASLTLVFLMVVIIPDQFYQAIFGKAFEGVKSHLIFLSAAMIFFGGYLIMSYWQSANGRFIQNFYAHLAAVAVNGIMSLAFFLTGNYSIKNGILALGSGYIILCIVSVFQFRSEQKSR
ncbi:hypothetical protein BH10BAC3_BH10BAC3_20320 [soil metagenome]